MELIERVKGILEKYYICDECLGRQFHNMKEIGEKLIDIIEFLS